MAKSFLLNNRFDILERFARLEEATGLVKSQMVVELDFVTKEGQSSSPASRKEFQVVPASEYLDGSRMTHPDWILRDAEDVNLAGLTTSFKCTYDGMTPEHVMFFVAYKGGYLSSKIIFADLAPHELTLFHDCVVTRLSASLALEPNIAEAIATLQNAHIK